ncbi:MAG: T9SS type A sorting domain-containing protein [Candidatus Methylacidiphilales bacterium]
MSNVKAQWSEVSNLKFENAIGNLTYVNSNKIWLTYSSGSNGTRILEYDSMFNFTRQINISPYNIQNVQSVFASRSDTVFLRATIRYGNFFRLGLLATYDGGNSFTTDFFFNTLDFSTNGTNVSFFNSKIGYFIKDTVDKDCFLTYQTYNAGKSWERITDCDRFKYTFLTGQKPSAYGGDVKNIRLNGSTIFLGWTKQYDSNYVRFTFDYGNTWYDKVVNQLNTDFIANRNAARYILYGYSSPFIAYTKDSGNTFQKFQRNEIINNISYCEDPNGDGFYMMTTENGTFINYNEDNNWKKIDNENFGVVQFYSTTNGYAQKYINNLEVQVYQYKSDDKVGLESVIKIESLFSIFPNPTTSQLNITSNSNIKTVLIYNVTGQLVKEINYENNNLKDVSLAIDDLAQGMYMVQIIDELNAKLTSKFIKE